MTDKVEHCLSHPAYFMITVFLVCAVKYIYNMRSQNDRKAFPFALILQTDGITYKKMQVSSVRQCCRTLRSLAIFNLEILKI